MCQGCPPNTPNSYNLNYLYNNSDCTDCNNCAGIAQDSSCVTYSSGNLTCSGILTGDSVEVAIQKIEEKLCVTTGGYSGFNFSCLGSISGEQDFAETIAAYVCTLRGDLTNFTAGTYVSDKGALNTRLNALEKPVASGCGSYLAFSSGDTLQQTLNKISSKICSIHTVELDISSINWGSCLSLENSPTTVPQAFQVLADQVCAIVGGTGSALPTFNNTGSCLPSPGASDSLVSTVTGIRSRLCQTGTFDINALSWGCITKPSTTTTDLQGAFQAVITALGDYKQNKLTFSTEDFVVTSTDESNPCAGKTIALATPINQDRLTAATASDTSPGTLQNKLQEGTGITLDYTTPGKVIISSSGGVSDGKVKVDVAGTPGYLTEKIVGSVGDFVSIQPTQNGDTVKINSSFVMSNFLPLFFDELESNEAMRDRFCQLIASCPSPCQSPNNVQALVVS